ALETARADRAASVRAVGARWAAAESAAPVEDALVLPEPAPVPPWALPQREADRVAADVATAVDEATRRHNDQMRQYQQRHPNPAYRAPAPLAGPSASEVRALAALLASEEPPSVGAKAAMSVSGGFMYRAVVD